MLQITVQCEIEAFVSIGVILSVKLEAVLHFSTPCPYTLFLEMYCSKKGRKKMKGK